VTDFVAAKALPAAHTALDRFLAAIPFTIAALVALSVLLWEAASLKTPTIFGDELEWSMISRAIAHTGAGARLGQPTGFRSLYAYLIAPAWWLPTTHAAYTAIKYGDTLVMASAAIPVYLLGRRLLPKNMAAAAAIATLFTSGYFYASLILPETLAFPVFAWAAYAAVEALARGGRPWWIAAVVLVFVGVAVRTELAASAAALAIAAGLAWVVGPTGKRIRAGWSFFQNAGAALFVIGLLLLANRIVGPHVHEWWWTWQYWHGRIWHYGFVSLSALAIGLVVLPAIGGLASLWIPERRNDPYWRAFAIYLFASLITFSIYTGVKGAYNSTQIFSRVEERNLIYLAPLLLIGTAIVLTQKRIWVPGIVAATAFVAWLVIYYGYQLNDPYSDAPGYGVAVFANRGFYWGQPDIRRALAVCVAISAGVFLLQRLRRVPSAMRRGVVALACLATVVAMGAGEVTSARGSISEAKRSLANLTPPLDWIDRATHGQGVTYLGNHIGDPTGLWLTEFWNRSIDHVDTLDGSSPGPGPSVTPSIYHDDGSLSGDPSLSYVVAESDVSLAEPVVESHGGLTLYRLPSHPWRLRQAVYGRTGDGWIVGTNDDKTAAGTYAYFAPPRVPGLLSISIGRQFCPAHEPIAHAVIRVGPLALDSQRLPIVRRATFVRSIDVPTCAAPKQKVRTLTFEIAPPFAVQVEVSPTISPADYGASDARQLGAQVGFGFSPRKR
jgi:hypothetical protein